MPKLYIFDKKEHTIRKRDILCSKHLLDRLVFEFFLSVLLIYLW